MLAYFCDECCVLRFGQVLLIPGQQLPSLWHTASHQQLLASTLQLVSDKLLEIQQELWPAASHTVGAARRMGRENISSMYKWGLYSNAWFKLCIHVNSICIQMSIASILLVVWQSPEGDTESWNGRTTELNSNNAVGAKYSSHALY